MLTINPTLYERLAELLVEAIEHRSYYSDKIYFEDSEADYLFSSSLIIYYRHNEYPEGRRAEISKIVPTWWEFHSTTEQGEELNDFDFNILEQIICR
ncbi:MAG: hypothetical protein R3Y08_01685 [Rikenellaceae bacterium]